jgi:hypothetical protein
VGVEKKTATRIFAGSIVAAILYFEFIPILFGTILFQLKRGGFNYV